MASSDPAASVVKGLDGVLACTTAVCSINGEAGELRYRGYDIRDLVNDVPFADVAQLLWLGEWPSEQQSASFAAAAVERRELPSLTQDLLAALGPECEPLAAMRIALSIDAALDKDAATSPAVIADRAITVHAHTATVVGALSCLVRGEDVRAPRRELDHCENLLWMATGRDPEPLAVGALNAVLVTYAEHELNASTFTARTVVGTLSDYWSALTAAIGALKGPLHGGAVDDAIKLFLAIGSPEAVPAYLDRALAEKVKIPGFGHRVYRTRDPRAVGMERYAELLCAAQGDDELLRTAQALEKELLQRKGLSANVDYYGALVMHLLGFPHEVFSALIAASRYAGWTAHVCEQYADNKLIRPRAVYTGPAPRPLVPLSRQ